MDQLRRSSAEIDNILTRSYLICGSTRFGLTKGMKSKY